MDIIQTATTLLADSLAILSARQWMLVMAGLAGLALIFRLNAALRRIERAMALPDALRTDVAGLRNEVSALTHRVAEARAQAVRNNEDPLAVYRTV